MVIDYCAWFSCGRSLLMIIVLVVLVPSISSFFMVFFEGLVFGRVGVDDGDWVLCYL